VLSPYRVVDCTNERGLLCGQILADLGADVIHVEPPGGSSARGVGPFAKDERGPETSLFWWAYARNQRSVSLDFESAADRELALQLASGADFWIESEVPGRMAELGLGYADLAAVNPGLVYVSISAFGQTGPKSGWADSDLTLAAASGVAYLSGEGDRPPVRVSVPQAHAHAGADAAVGALIAHNQRRATGRGQHVDVSTQQSLTLATMFRSLDAPVEQVPAKRTTGGVQVGAAWLPTRYPAKDGWVVLGPAFLASTGHFMNRLLRLAVDDGHGDASLLEEDWGSFAGRLFAGQLGANAFDAADAALSGYLKSKTKDELIDLAVRDKLLLAPVLGLDDVFDSEQLADRDFERSIERPDGGGSARVPGPFAKFSATPVSYRLPPPRVDEHGAAIRAEPPRQPAATGATASRALPLEGVKILDLFWVLAGPGATRMLADYGASVVHVESMRHIDTLRVIQPFRFGQPHAETSSAFQSANCSKLGITLDLAQTRAREIALELVQWADVVTESFAPGVIDQYGLGWETLRAVKPDLIMISSCLMGQSGPWRDLTGFGNLAASVTGFQQLASWPDRPPAGPFGAYTDFINVRYNAAAILAALDHRDRTGEGQYIDESQCEGALHFLAPAILDYSVNGRAPQAAGNFDADLSPHGIYPTAGEDAWIAIAVRSDAEWRALCGVMERSDLIEQRCEREHVDNAIGNWTKPRDGSQLEAALQAAGIPAHRALDTPALFECEQLQHRGHFIEVEHEIFPTTFVESSRLLLSDTPARVPKRALNFGRDNREVLERLLGYSPEQIAELAAQGVLY
jgi:crotonobetainyl-CoA:carnitine CoA-transferase CaiB-like acyl-CoA transferase